VLLLSDGQANVGPSSAEELGRYGALLMKDGIAVSTVGLGVDYNEDLMTRLSQKSDGNSYFVEKSDDLPRIFSGELGDVLSVAATRVALKVHFRTGFTPVALIGRDGRILDGVVSIDLNQLYGGQEKYVIVKCDAAPGAVGSAREIAKAEVTYVDPKNEASKTVTGVGTVTYSADPAAVAASVNKSVLRERALNENAVRTEEALRLADRGDFEAAQNLLELNSANSRDVQRVIGRDRILAADAYMQMENVRNMNSGSYDAAERKKMKTSSFQLRNQQSDKSK
jgi:Ca-activated chloride channel family protein